jgi:S1-C subfamily serine protease
MDVDRSLAVTMMLVASLSAARTPERWQQSDPPQQPAAGVKPAEPRFRLVRSMSGTKGTEVDGRLVIEDPRTIFYIPDDKQVVVYFEWEGPAGQHRFEALWKDPEGKLVVISDFSLEPKEHHFAGYFTMLLGENIPTGLWSAEARIDGETAGTHSFQIVSARRPANVMPTRRILSRAEIYKRAAAASVFIENVSRTGERQNLGTGFFVSEELVLTTFQVIDGAAAIRIVGPDGRRAEVKDVLAWNRRQGWAILKAQLGKTPVLGHASPDSWAIGDRCYSLDVPAEGNLVILEGNLTGKLNATGAGERLNVSFSPAPRAIGSPLLNEYGEVIGMMGAGLIPGSSQIGVTAFPTFLSASGAMAIPITMIPDVSPDARPTTLEELERSGQFTPPLAGRRYVTSGTLSRSIDRKSGSPQSVDERTEFSRRDGHAALLITWYPEEKRKGVPSIRLYDIENHLVFESKSKRITLNPNRLAYSMWELTLGDLPTGIYRIDILIDSDPVWRTFFRMTE